MVDKTIVLLAILKYAKETGQTVTFSRNGWNICFGVTHRSSPSNVFIPWIKRHETYGVPISESVKAAIQKKVNGNVTIDELLSDCWTAEETIRKELTGGLQPQAKMVDGIKISPRMVGDTWYFEYEITPAVGYRIKDDLQA